MGDGRRPGNARPTPDRVEDVLRLLRGVRRPAQHERLPGVPRAAGRTPGAQRARARVHRAREERVRAQELLLSRPAEGLPDLTVRAAARDGWHAVVPVTGARDSDGYHRTPAR